MKNILPNTEPSYSDGNSGLSEQNIPKINDFEIPVNGSLSLLQSAIIEHMAEGIAIIKADDGIIVYTNPKFENLLGYSNGELLGRHISTINAPTEISPEETFKNISTTLFATGSWQGEILNLKKDGNFCWGHATVSEFMHPDFGKVWISIHHDISKRKIAEEKLRDSKLKLDMAMQAAHMAWWEMEIASGKVSFDDNKAEMLGYSPEKFKHYNDFVELVHPDDRENTMNAMRDHLYGNNEKYEVEYRILNSKGDYTWYYDVGSIVKRDADGKPTNIAGVVICIDDRKQTEKALQQSELSYRNLVQHSPDIIYKFSNKRGGLFWSDRVKEILGFLPEEICEDPFLWNNSIHPDDQALVKNAIEEDSNGNKYNIDYRIKAKNGNWVWLHDYFMDKRIIDDEVIIEGHATDITQRKKMEDSLRILSWAVDQSPVSIIITDTNGTIEYVNPKFTQLTGYSLIEAYEKTPQILKTGYTTKEEYDSLWKTIKSGNEWTGEFCNKKKNGELYWEAAVISPIINEKGEITHFVAVKEDITKQKETERRIQAHIIEAEERERLHFSQELHDGIGPLLSATKMYVQWLGMPNAKIETSEIIKDIEKFLDESAKTIHDLSFKLSPHILQNFGLIDAVESYTQRVNKSSGLNITLNTVPLPRFDLNAETVAYRVLCECLNNSIKHSKATQITIDITSRNDLLMVKCCDNGIGFDPDQISKERMGIGHLNMQNRIKSLNGQLNIISAPGKGTVIKFSLKMLSK